MSNAAQKTPHNFEYDVLVLGGGPGGYPAAIRAAQLGLKTGCIERDKLGGVCLNWGCIPTKALLKNAEIYHQIQIAPKEWGITYDNLQVDFSKVVGRSRGVSDKVVKGIEYLFRKNKVDHIKGLGVLSGKNSIEVTGPEGKKTITAKNIIIATGARARLLPDFKPDGKQFLTSTEAMIMDHIPESMTIIGAGAIGIEFAYFYHTFGTKVTVIEMQPNILPVEDTEVSTDLEKLYKKQGMQIFTKTKVLSVKKDGNRTKVEIESLEGGAKQTIDAECTLLAIGVVGNVENIGLEKLGITMTKGWIDVDDYMRTNVEGIYAVGDVAGAPWLAHVATHEGIVASEHIAKLSHVTPVDYDNIPGCTYCVPQVASVGLTERAAKERGIEYKVGKFPFTALGKAKAINETDGFIKLIFEKKYGELIGAHLIGPEATEMLQELVVARSHGATAVSILKTVHAHPTLSEAIMEAAAVAEGEAIHI